MEGQGEKRGREGEERGRGREGERERETDLCVKHF